MTKKRAKALMSINKISSKELIKMKKGKVLENKLFLMEKKLKANGKMEFFANDSYENLFVNHLLNFYAF